MIVSDPEEPERSRQLVYLSGGIFFALTLFASEAGKIFGRDGIDWVKAYGVYLLGSIIMAVSVYWVPLGINAIGVPAVAERLTAAVEAELMAVGA